MSMIDDKGRLFGKVNVVDLAIVLLILSVLGLVFIRMTNRGIVGSPIDEENRVIYEQVQGTILIEKVRPEVAELVSETEEVYFGNSRSKLKVIDVKVNPTKLVSFTSEGKAVQTEDPFYQDVIVTIQGKGELNTETEELLLEGERLAVGLGGEIRKDFVLGGNIIGFKVEN